MRKLRLRRRTCSRTQLVRWQSFPHPRTGSSEAGFFPTPRSLCRMNSPAGRGRKEPVAPSRIRNPVPSPEPRQDPCVGGPNHPILQEKGKLYCMAVEAAISCPQIRGRQGSWNLQSTKVGRTPPKKQSYSNHGRGSSEPDLLVLGSGAPRRPGREGC